MKIDVLKPPQVLAIASLAATGNVKIAAQHAGVSERTLRRWLSLPMFREALLGAESEAIHAAARRLNHLAQKALGVLEEVLDDTEAAHTPRVGAARTVLDLCLKWREQVELEERVRALERKVRSKR